MEPRARGKSEGAAAKAGRRQKKETRGVGEPTITTLLHWRSFEDLAESSQSFHGHSPVHLVVKGNTFTFLDLEAVFFNRGLIPFSCNMTVGGPSPPFFSFLWVGLSLVFGIRIHSGTDMFVWLVSCRLRLKRSKVLQFSPPVLSIGFA